MKEKLLDILNIRPNEIFLVKYLFFTQFFIGVGLAFLYTAASTMFLHSAEIKDLTTIYLIAGVALIFINYIYSYVEHHYSLKNAFKWSVLLAIGSLFIFTFCMSEHSHGVPVFFLLIWYHLIYYLCNSGFWGIASIVFNVREGKRVFSLIGSGDIPAKMLGYLSVSILVPYVGIHNLLWVSIACFIIAFAILSIFFSRHHLEEEHVEHEKVNVEKEVKAFVYNPLILFIGLSTIIFAASTVMIDYTFLSEVKMKYATDTSLASFLSVFFAWSRLIAIAVKILLSSKIQNALGIKGTLFVLPVMIILFSISIMSFSALSSSNMILYFFGMLMVFTEVVKSTIYEPMFFVLFQPLKPSERLRGHNITKGIMLPIGYIVMSLGIAFHLYTHEVLNMNYITGILIAISLIWLAVIVFIEKNYYQTVRNAIAKNSFFNISQTSFLKDNASYELFEQKLIDGHPIEKVTALQYLVELDRERTKHKIMQFLNHEEDDRVIEYVLNLIVDYKWTDAIPVLTELLHAPEKKNIKGKILKTLCIIDGDNFNDYFKHCHHDRKEECECITGALVSENLSAIINAGQILIGKLNASNKEEKIEALKIIENTENPILYKQIQLLLHEKDDVIKRKILESIIKIKNPVFIEYIVNHLSHEHLKIVAEKCMVSYSDIWIKDINTLETRVNKNKLIEYLVKSSNDDLYDMLLTLFYETPNVSLTNYLYKKKKKLNNNEYIKGLIGQQVQKLNKINTLLGQCDDMDIRNALKNEYKDAITYSLQLMYLLNDSNKVSDIYFIILHEKKSKYPEAMELLEFNTKKHHLISLIKAVEIFTENNFAENRGGGFVQVCNDVLDHESLFNDWTIALSLYKLTKTNRKIKNPSLIVTEILSLNN